MERTLEIEYFDNLQPRQTSIYIKVFAEKGSKAILDKNNGNNLESQHRGIDHICPPGRGTMLVCPGQ